MGYIIMFVVDHAESFLILYDQAIEKVSFLPIFLSEGFSDRIFNRESDNKQFIHLLRAIAFEIKS